jgi:PD-(D/E)XK nuclease superfamily
MHSMPDKPTLRRSEVQAILACTSYESGPSPNAALGSVVHDAIAAYILTCRTAGEETRLDQVEQLATEAFFRIPRGLDAGRLEEARMLLDRFARTHVAELATLLHVEKTLTHDVGFALINGTVDRIDRADGGDPDDPFTEILISDWKTSWAVEEHAFQMMFYAALACHTWPSVEAVTTRVDHFRLNDGIVEASYTRGWLLQWFGDIMVGLQKRLTEPKGEPTGGVACQFCAKRLTCGYAIAPFNAVPENDGQVEEIIQDWIRLDAAELETRKVLETYFSARLAMEVNGLEVGWLEPHDPVFRAVADVDTIEAAAKGLMLDLEQLVEKKLRSRGVPMAAKRALVDAGVAEFVPGPATFKARKARTKKAAA